MMRKIIIASLALFALGGCVPAVFVAGTAAGAAAGAVIYDHRGAKTMVADRDMVFRIQNKFSQDRQLRNKANLSITSFNRIVLLLGQVPNANMRDQVEEIVRVNSNIKMLYNEITIEKPISKMTRANDTWITAKVKTVLATTSGLTSSTLKIVTENGVVYLMGMTTRAQAKLAADRTRTVSGVKKVVKLFEYLS